MRAVADQHLLMLNRGSLKKASEKKRGKMLDQGKGRQTCIMLEYRIHVLLGFSMLLLIKPVWCKDPCILSISLFPTTKTPN